MSDTPRTDALEAMMTAQGITSPLAALNLARELERQLVKQIPHPDYLKGVKQVTDQIKYAGEDFSDTFLAKDTTDPKSC